MKVEPKYKLGELVVIRALKNTMEVEITKRILKGDYDKEEFEFYYNYKHKANIKNGWTWEDVSEKGLGELIFEAEWHNRKSI